MPAWLNAQLHSVFMTGTFQGVALQSKVIQGIGPTCPKNPHVYAYMRYKQHSFTEIKQSLHMPLTHSRPCVVWCRCRWRNESARRWRLGRWTRPRAWFPCSPWRRHAKAIFPSDNVKSVQSCSGLVRATNQCPAPAQAREPDAPELVSLLCCHPCQGAHRAAQSKPSRCAVMPKTIHAFACILHICICICCDAMWPRLDVVH